MKFFTKGRVVLLLILTIGVCSIYAVRSHLNDVFIKGTQALEALSFSYAQKPAVVEYYSLTKSCPNNLLAAAGDVSLSTDIYGKYVLSVVVQNAADGQYVEFDGKRYQAVCEIQAKMRSRVEGVDKRLADKTVTLLMTAISEDFVWSCTSTMPQKFLPSTCKGS